MNAELIELTDKEFSDKLDDKNPPVNILGMSYGTRYALKEIDLTPSI